MSLTRAPIRSGWAHQAHNQCTINGFLLHTPPRAHPEAIAHKYVLDFTRFGMIGAAPPAKGTKGVT